MLVRKITSCLQGIFSWMSERITDDKLVVAFSHTKQKTKKHWLYFICSQKRPTTAMRVQSIQASRLVKPII